MTMDPPRCGKSNPEGYPRALRPKLRSVLLGEYPWRARIYHFQDPNTPLCAATFINREGRTLMTAASCVAGLNPNSLRVLFEEDPNNYDPINVLKVDVHEFYDRDINVNNIALLSLESVPDWVRPACLPIRRVLHGTACVAVSSEDYFINQVVPLQRKCDENNKPLDGSLMCAASYKGDYAPQFGGGMFCLDEQSKHEVYTLYGVYLYSVRGGMAAINTNVNHFAEWIAKKTTEHRRMHRNYQ
ncbi:jg15265 [Pararge aegeria aegeria]|uniref:Jg15265 protein n=2 Tax=Pararge aegeria TaxID=116150 RepID=A0A8S4QXD0_9NEOP|nr:jg15265 [Pararge aegeria aegeria]